MDKDIFNNLMDKVRSADKEAFRKIYEEYGNKIQVVAFCIVKDHHIAEDILAEVMLKLWKGKFGQVENPTAFIYEIAKNLSLDYLRKNAEFRKILCFDDIAESEIALTVESIQSIIDVAVILDKLNDIERDIVLKRVIFKDTYQEVAKDLGISEHIAKRKYKKVINMLKNSFLVETDKGEAV